MHLGRRTDSVLWSYRTTLGGSTGESPFTLVYGTEATILAELEMPSHRILHFDEEHNSQLLKEHLGLVDELRETAFIRNITIQELDTKCSQQEGKSPMFPSRRPGATKSRYTKTSGKTQP
ncbi:UNVERIFIED_CONTAM: hypothetical protein Sradi_0689100 [Sesamum radiatum]|uniref:Uncharacterized protein n=1 Tax=Sesamum radiatum TaxID=300843 RepID=A0AAW2VS40_SESRA